MLLNELDVRGFRRERGRPEKLYRNLANRKHCLRGDSISCCFTSNSWSGGERTTCSWINDRHSQHCIDFAFRSPVALQSAATLYVSRPCVPFIRVITNYWSERNSCKVVRVERVCVCMFVRVCSKESGFRGSTWPIHAARTCHHNDTQSILNSITG